MQFQLFPYPNEDNKSNNLTIILLISRYENCKFILKNFSIFFIFLMAIISYFSLLNVKFPCFHRFQLNNFQTVLLEETTSPLLYQESTQLPIVRISAVSLSYFLYLFISFNAREKTAAFTLLLLQSCASSVCTKFRVSQSILMRIIFNR